MDIFISQKSYDGFIELGKKWFPLVLPVPGCSTHICAAAGALRLDLGSSSNELSPAAGGNYQIFVCLRTQLFRSF